MYIYIYVYTYIYIYIQGLGLEGGCSPEQARLLSRHVEAGGKNKRNSKKITRK